MRTSPPLLPEALPSAMMGPALRILPGWALIWPAPSIVIQPEADRATVLPRKAPWTVMFDAWIANGPAATTFSVSTLAPTVWTVKPPGKCWEPRISVSGPALEERMPAIVAPVAPTRAPSKDADLGLLECRCPSIVSSTKPSGASASRMVCCPASVRIPSWPEDTLKDKFTGLEVDEVGAEAANRPRE